MSLALSGDTVAYLMGLGLDAEQMKGLIDRLQRDAMAVTPPASASGINEERERLRNESTYAERKRAKDRERRAAEREELRRLKAEREATATTPATPREATATAGDHGGPGGDEPATPSRVRVRDITPKLVNIPNLTTPDGECAWPETEPPSRADLDRLEAALRQAAGAALNAVSPRLFDLSPMLRLARQGKGPPCDLQADVIPTIRARSARAPPGSVKSWDFYRDAITEARDRRLSGAPETGPAHERSHPDHRQAAREDSLRNMHAGAMAALNRRLG